MALKVTLQYIFFCRCLCCVLGTVINTQIPGNSSAVHIHCLSGNSLIQIKDPFNSSLIHDEKFIAMEWYQLKPSGPNNEFTETLLLQFFRKEINKPLEKFTVFEFWGLQINNVDLNDSAKYLAKLVHLSKDQEWFVHIVVATPPVLESEKLTTSTTVSKDGQSVLMSCGRIKNLGSPPVSFLWKQTDSGAVMPVVYQDGYLKLNLTSELDTGKYICDFDLTAPAARCIAEKDMPRFKWALTQSRKIESSDMTDAIAGVAVAVAVVGIIVIIAVIVMRKRCAESEVYNAREHEKKRDQENDQDNKTSLYKDEEKSHERSQAPPIYNGYASHDSFMISKVSEENTNLIYMKTKPQNPPVKNMVYLNGKQTIPSGISNKQREENENHKQDNDHKNWNQTNQQRPPQTKPRNVFPSSSTEELDKTGRIFSIQMDNGVATINQGTLV